MKRELVSILYFRANKLMTERHHPGAEHNVLEACRDLTEDPKIDEIRMFIPSMCRDGFEAHMQAWRWTRATAQATIGA